MLGQYAVEDGPGYIQLAQEEGLRTYFNLGRAYSLFDYLGDARFANQGFLDGHRRKQSPSLSWNRPVYSSGNKRVIRGNWNICSGRDSTTNQFVPYWNMY